MAIRLYRWKGKRQDNLENYGDLLSLYLAKKLSNKKIIPIKHPSKGFQKYFFKNYLSIGSIISSATEKSLVWGSGIIKADENIRKANFLAVRGPRTRKRILELGYDCPETYGDPAILLPNFYNPTVQKKYKIGIIPHYVDFKEVAAVFKESKITKVINLMTNSIEHTTQEILKCEHIISSSLHGVIIAQAYRIPSLWVKFSNKLFGDNIKFYDYYESMGINFTKEFFIVPKDLSIKKIEELLETNKEVLLQDEKILELRKNELLKSCPF
ncbi:polysaccharide pyruvyl transferase family protein [Gelatiniphilus marinus]|uniref:Polysaccharide pyruvyl transferase family protein n=1 Tax=Gelatiniphilus marinus TaxID=1759464 RepID=A0ABW5JS68_9FLAO